MNERIASNLENSQSLSSLAEGDRRSLCTDFYLVSGSLAKLIKNKVVSDQSLNERGNEISRESGHRDQVYSQLGEDCGSVCARLRNNGWLEANRGDGWRKNWEVAPHLCSGRMRRICGSLHHSPSGRLWSSGEHNARTFIRNRRDHGRKSLGPAKGNSSQYFARLGSDFARVHVSRRRPLRVWS